MLIARISGRIARAPALIALVMTGFALLAGSPASGKSTAEHTQDVRTQHEPAVRNHEAAKQRFQAAAAAYRNALMQVRNDIMPMQRGLRGIRAQIQAKQAEIARLEQGQSQTLPTVQRIGRLREEIRNELQPQAQRLSQAISDRRRYFRNFLDGHANELRQASRAAGIASQALRLNFTGETAMPPVQVQPVGAGSFAGEQAILGHAGRALGHHNGQEQARAQALNELAVIEGNIRALNEVIPTLPQGSQQRQFAVARRNQFLGERNQQLAEFRSAEQRYRAVLGNLNMVHPPPAQPPVFAAPANIAVQPNPAALATLAQGGVQYTAAPAVPAAQQGAAPAAPLSTYEVVPHGANTNGPTHQTDYEDVDAELDGGGGATSSTAAVAVPLPPAAVAQINQGVVHHNQFNTDPVNQPGWWDQL